MASEKRLIDDFTQLVSIDSVSFNERQFADALIVKLRELGLKVEEDDAGSIIGSNAGNIYAVMEGDESEPSILLSAHMDTVVPGISKRAIVDYDRRIITSDGTTVLGSDDVAGIVEILEGIRKIKETGERHKRVELLFSVAEEVYTRGAAVFDYSKLKAGYGYCFDLSGSIGITALKAPSLIAFSVTVNGKSAHAGFEPEKGINAIAVMAEAISQIPQGRIGVNSTFNIGLIEGGSATNIVSQEAKCKGEVRSYSHKEALELIESAKRVFEDVAGDKGADVDFSYEILLKAYEVQEEDMVLSEFDKACSRLNAEAIHTVTFGGADAHRFNENGIKSLVVSCGMTDVHTVQESVKIDDLIMGADLVYELVKL